MGPNEIDRRAAEIKREFPDAIPPVPIVVTGRSDTPPSGTVIETPAGKPNLVIETMTPLAQVLVRTARTFVQSMIGFLAFLTIGRPVAEGLGVVIPVNDTLDLITTAAGLSVFPTVVTFLMNAGEMLGKLDVYLAKWRA